MTAAPWTDAFSGRTALITGGGGGIGAAAAARFAAAGATCFVGDLGLSEETTVDGVRRRPLDVSDRASVERFVRAAEAEVGRLDILVNSAGVREITPFLELDPEEWRRVLAVNLDGVFHASQVFARALTARERGGVIVNLASVAGLMGVPDRPAYVASKHGVVGLTREMAMELGPYGVRVNAIAPGSVRTPMTARFFDDPALVERLEAGHPLGRVAEPEEIADAILYAASDLAGFMTGAVLTVDGGYSAGKGW
ncbi:MAG: SDR family oxidoreductase [Alphaproteobacteria bacterium]|nr:SDR family oxidoreductase [Alphaproteobacteria bacterium]